MSTPTQILSTFSPDFSPEEVAHLAVAMQRLPADQQYTLLDLETDYDLLLPFLSGEDQCGSDLLPVVLGTTVLHEWAGSSYGATALLDFGAGKQGVDFMFGGSPMNSAFTMYVVPLGLLGPGVEAVCESSVAEKQGAALQDQQAPAPSEQA